MPILVARSLSKLGYGNYKPGFRRLHSSQCRRRFLGSNRCVAFYGRCGLGWELFRLLDGNPRAFRSPIGSGHGWRSNRHRKRTSHLPKHLPFGCCIPCCT